MSTPAITLDTLCAVHSRQAHCIKLSGLYWDGQDFQPKAHNALWLSADAAFTLRETLSRLMGCPMVYCVTLTDASRIDAASTDAISTEEL